MTYFVLYLVSIVSPFLAIAEPLVILSAMSGRTHWLAMAVVVALAGAVVYMRDEHNFRWVGGW